MLGSSTQQLHQSLDDRADGDAFVHLREGHRLWGGRIWQGCGLPHVRHIHHLRLEETGRLIADMALGYQIDATCHILDARIHGQLHGLREGCLLLRDRLARQGLDQHVRAIPHRALNQEHLEVSNISLFALHAHGREHPVGLPLLVDVEHQPIQLAEGIHLRPMISFKSPTARGPYRQLALQFALLTRIVARLDPLAQVRQFRVFACRQPLLGSDRQAGGVVPLA